MAYCGNCGNLLKDGVKFCPKCGQPTKNVGDIMNFVSYNNSTEKKVEEQIQTWQKVIVVLFWPAGVVLTIVSFIKKKKAIAYSALLYTSIGLVLTMIFSAVLSGCGNNSYRTLVGRNSLDNEVKKIMVETMRGQGHNISVTNLSLVHHGGNDYEGLADGTFDGERVQWNVYAVYDGVNVKAEWQPTAEYVQKENNRIYEEQQREYDKMMKEYQKQADEATRKAEEELQQIEFETDMQMRMNEWYEPN